MAIISFTLSEEGMAVFHDALACILKFADEVCLEARSDRVPKHTFSRHYQSAS